ncbi:Glutamate carboxypeptidase 2 [Folsomia candida]|uniref:Glutamate carboxypeptidase 2 n=1 Tax=Folsomia candida TaxID=158441 RepID=A0A226EJS8_FOLCA|nr:Glutamate carboxypeptidase 2 [Folsomia candida]
MESVKYYTEKKAVCKPFPFTLGFCRATEFSYAEVLGKNGSAVFRTSEFDDHLNPRPMMAFSPPADLHGTLIYAHYGRVQDLDFLNASRVRLDRSVALIRFGGPHPSKVAEIAAMYGIGAILFYPDPQDYGPQLPLNSVRFSSLLTLGEIHEYQKHKSKFIIPAHTISPGDAQELLRYIRQGNWMKRAPPNWQGGLKTPYFLGPTTTVQTSSKFGQTTSAVQVRLRIFNEPQIREIYNVVAAIPGAWESDRYIVVGCSHDAWNSGAGDPGIGIALISEMARSFSNAVQKGWKPRRSILFISFDANLFASSGVSHWLQEHHFEISSRTIAYIDLSRVLRGNETLHVHSSPILNSVARKAIARVVTHADSSSVSQPNPSEEEKEVEGGWRNGSAAIYFSSLVTSDEPSFAFLNLGIPFFRISVSNSPKGYDYPLFHTSFDTAENFANSVDPELKGAKTLGKIILETIVLLADSIVLPINVEDYVMEIQKAFGNFIQQYQQELHRGNLSIAYLQAAVMRLEVIGDNFQTEMHNRTVINPEYDTLPAPSPSPKTIKSKKALLHRIINDKLMEIDRAFLSRSSDVYKHLVLGFTSNMDEIRINGTADNMSTSLDHFFPKLRESLECGRRVHELAEEQEPGIKEIKTISLSRSGSKINSFAKHRSRRIRSREKKFRTRDLDGIGTFALDTSICHDWHIVASQRIASLTRALDAASAILQSPLLPEESE